MIRKLSWALSLAVLSGLLIVGTWGARASEPELGVYAYETLLGKDSLGERLRPLFEARCGCRLKYIAVGSGAQLVSRIQIDLKRGKLAGALALGVDALSWPTLRSEADDWGRWRPAGYARIPKELQLETGFLPFDYGVLGWIMDREKLASPPALGADLLGAAYRRMLLLQDPRTSLPGLQLLLWKYQVEQDASARAKFWRAMKSQWLTLAPSWGAAYQLFLKGEAPLVWSYTTSQAYHREHGDTKGRYQAWLPEGEGPVHVEGAVVLRGAPQSSRGLAREFLDFLLTDEVQKLIPQANWMLPVSRTVELPESFRSLPQPRSFRVIRIREEQERRKALEEWGRWVREKP